MNNALRVGIDLVSTDAVRESISAHGARYLERVFTDREVADCRTAADVDPDRLAARFAAKEATLKVLRAGDEAVPWRDIEVRRDPSGWVELLLAGRAATLAKDAGITDLALSLTHERGFASAVVIAEIRHAADI
jgi:holo-[acyl-carrier protein] synthase